MHTDQTSFGHFSQAALLILSSLQSGPKDGHTIIEAIEQDRGVYMEPSTLYASLARMERRGWIEAMEVPYRRLYGLTDSGVIVLYQHLATLHERDGQATSFARHRHMEEKIMKALSWVLRLYPPAWRERYEGEMIALLEQHDITLLTLLDLLLGALDARLDPHYRAPQILLPLQRMKRIRDASITAFCAFSIFLFCYYALILDSVDGPWDALRNTNPIVAVAYAISNIGTLMALGSIIVAGMIVTYTTAKQANTLQRKGLWFLPIASFLFPIMILLLIILMPTLNNPAFVIFFLGVLAFPLAVALAVAKSKVSERILRIVLVPGTIAAFGLAAHLGGLIISQVVTSFVWPGGNWSIQLVLGLVLMALPTIFAMCAVVRGLVALVTRTTATGGMAQPMPSQSSQQFK